MKIMLLGGEADGRTYEVPEFRPSINVQVMEGEREWLNDADYSPNATFKSVAYHFSRRLSSEACSIFVIGSILSNSEEAASMLISKALESSAVPTGTSIMGMELHVLPGEYPDEVKHVVRALRDFAKSRLGIFREAATT